MDQKVGAAEDQLAVLHQQIAALAQKLEEQQDFAATFEERVADLNLEVLNLKLSRRRLEKELSAERARSADFEAQIRTVRGSSPRDDAPLATKP